MKYVLETGKNNHLIITLHGTGGSATDLFDIAKLLDKNATVIGFEGAVLENGMRRYFKRFPQGGFDLENLSTNTKILYNSINKAIEKHNLKNSIITVIGYSNGANIAKNIFKEFDNIKINNAILFHPSVINPSKDYQRQSNINVLITYGKNDPYINKSEFLKMFNDMKKASIKTEKFSHNSGHQLTNEELLEAKKYLSEVIEDKADEKI